MKDLIDRAMAIDAYGDWYVEEGTEEGFIGTVKQLLEGLPSVHPSSSCSHEKDTISRQAAIEAIKEDKIDLTNPNVVAVFKATGDFGKVETQVMTCDRHIEILKELPSAQPEIIQCKDCKHNPKESWFGCPMSHLSEEQRPGTAWCWRAERREDDHETD